MINDKGDVIPEDVMNDWDGKKDDLRKFCYLEDYKGYEDEDDRYGSTQSSVSALCDTLLLVMEKMERLNDELKEITKLIASNTREEGEDE